MLSAPVRPADAGGEAVSEQVRKSKFGLNRTEFVTGGKKAAPRGVGHSRPGCAQHEGVWPGGRADASRRAEPPLAEPCIPTRGPRRPRRRRPLGLSPPSLRDLLKICTRASRRLVGGPGTGSCGLCASAGCWRLRVGCSTWLPSVTQRWCLGRAPWRARVRATSGPTAWTLQAIAP